MWTNWKARLIAGLWFSSIAGALVLLGIPLRVPDFNNTEHVFFSIKIFMCAFPWGWILGYKIISINNKSKIKLIHAVMLGVAIVFLSSVNLSVCESIIANGISEPINIFSQALGILFLITVFGGIAIYPLGIAAACLLWSISKRINNEIVT